MIYLQKSVRSAREIGPAHLCKVVSKKNQNAKIARVFAGGSHTDPGATEPGTETTLEQGHRHDKAAKPNHG